MAINAKGFLKTISDNISGAGETIKNYSSALGTKRAQSKMIQNYVNSKPSKLPPEKRSISNVIAEKESMDKALRAKISKKNPSLLK